MDSYESYIEKYTDGGIRGFITGDFYIDPVDDSSIINQEELYILLTKFPKCTREFYQHYHGPSTYIDLSREKFHNKEITKNDYKHICKSTITKINGNDVIEDPFFEKLFELIDMRDLENRDEELVLWKLIT